MKQMSIQFKTRIQNFNIMNNNIEVERIVFNTMLCVLAGLAFWYVLTLGNMVFDIVQRKTLEKEMLILSNEVGGLELSYLSLSNSVDMSLSSSMGFKETKATFATRKSLGYNFASEALDSLKLGKNEI